MARTFTVCNRTENVALLRETHCCSTPSDKHYNDREKQKDEKNTTQCDTFSEMKLTMAAEHIKKRRLYSIYRIVRSNQLNMVLKPFIYHSTTWNAFSVSFCTIFGFVIVFIVCDLRNCVAVSFGRDVFVSLHFYYLVRNVGFFCLLLCYLFKTEISLFDVRNQFALYVHIVCMCKYVCVYVCFSHSAFISDSSIMSSIVFE